MIARRFMISTVALGLAVALGLTACSSSSKPASSTTPETTAPTPKTPPKVTVVAADFTFALPAQIPSGYVDVTIDNRGKEGHQVQFVKLGSMTLAQFKAVAVKTDIGAVKPGTVFTGGPNGADPGQKASALVKLDPGEYAVVCFIPANSDGKPHAAHGMISTVKVVHTAESDDVAPTPVSTITLGDFSFTLPAGFTGKGLVDISNQGAQAHEMVLVKLNPGKTLADAKSFLLTPPGTPPPAGPPPITFVPGIGGVTGLSPQQHAWLDMNLAPGNYVLLCFFPDTAKGGLPHALEGMIKEFTIA